MTRRSRRRRSGRSSETLKIVVGCGLLVAAIGALLALGYFYSTSERPPHLRADNQCPDDGWRSITVVILDTSDGLPAAAKLAVAKLLTDEAEASAAYGLFEIRTLATDKAGGKIIFSRCNPGDGVGASNLTTNVTRIRKRWLDGFRQPLDTAFETGLQTSKANASPIMATLQTIAGERFTGRAAAAMDKRLIIVSDMIEHSPEYSQYNGDFSYEKFKSSRAFKKFSTDFNGTSAKILYVQRLGSRKTNSGEHIRFWSDWIAGNNGRLTDAEKLPGAS